MARMSSIYTRVLNNFARNKTVKGVLPIQLNHSKTERQDFVKLNPTNLQDKVN